MRYTPNGQGVTSFGVATNRRWKDASGSVQEDTQFHDVVAWGKLAEAISQILKKGTKVAVIGRLQTRNWDAPDGSKRSRTEIVMEDFVPLTPKAGGPTTDEVDFAPADAGASSTPAAPKEAKASKKDEPTPAEGEINLDDIPF
jgi:single-strand DNA-binding protein